MKSNRPLQNSKKSFVDPTPGAEREARTLRGSAGQLSGVKVFEYGRAMSSRAAGRDTPARTASVIASLGSDGDIHAQLIAGLYGNVVV